MNLINYFFSVNAPEANPNISGKDSTSSATSNGSDGSSSDSGGSDLEGDLELGNDTQTPSDGTSTQFVSLKVVCLFHLHAQFTYVLCLTEFIYIIELEHILVLLFC